MSLKDVKNLARAYHFWPSKRLGQNFLISKSVLGKIIETANLSKDDIILEIGPGIGNLTRELAKRVKKVIAIEKDPKMIEILRRRLENFKNVKVIKGDILKVKNWRLEIGNFKVVANIPYYLTSPLIRKFLETKKQPKEMVLMVQKEVGQRICSKPPKMNLLAISVQFYAKPKIVSYVSKKSFWPEPKVDSAIIKISNLKLQIAKVDKHLFFKIVKAGFSQPRKQLVNNLSKELKIDKKGVKNWLLKNGVEPTQRAETLSVENWISLTKGLK